LQYFVPEKKMTQLRAHYYEYLSRIQWEQRWEASRRSLCRKGTRRWSHAEQTRSQQTILKRLPKFLYFPQFESTISSSQQFTIPCTW